MTTLSSPPGAVGRPPSRNRRVTIRYRCAPATTGRVCLVDDQEFQRAWVDNLSRGGAGLFTKSDKAGRPEDPLASLSPREMEVFSYLVNGLRAKDIADLLEISPKTVDTYRASLMRKLNVHDLVGLVKFAIERNLTSTSVPR